MPAQLGQTHVILMNLSERLRALPDFDPPAGGWQRLSSRMDSRRRRWMAAGGGLAVAASVLVAVGVSGLRPLSRNVAPPAVPRTALAPARADVARLIERSQRLENQLRQARPRVAVWDSGREHRADFLESRLSLIDARLNYARNNPDAPDTERLWSERVKLMNALLDLHQNEAPALQYVSYQY